VISAGRLSPEKNFQAFIESAALVRKKIPSAVFAVFGEGGLRKKLIRQIDNLGLRDCFMLPGFRKDFVSLLYEADVFVLPSRTEGMPMVLLEAHSAGLPIVATSVGGNAEIVEEGETGFLVQSGDTGALSEKIVVLLNNKELRQRMGKAGYERIQALFNIQSYTRKLEELYLKVIEGHKGKSL
jgi:glycosyltransferase involved in cell wall biosynthesis